MTAVSGDEWASRRSSSLRLLRPAAAPVYDAPAVAPDVASNDDDDADDDDDYYDVIIASRRPVVMTVSNHGDVSAGRSSPILTKLASCC